jgi:alpha-ribazole phosphatase
VPLAAPEQARAIATQLPIGQEFRLWTSPASRCRVVAEAIAMQCGVRPHMDPRLLELDFGAWEGCDWADVPRDALDLWAADPEGFAPPGGERGDSLIARARAFFWEIAAAGGAHVVVSHGGPLRVLAALARGQKVDLLAPPPALGAIEVFTV